MMMTTTTITTMTKTMTTTMFMHCYFSKTLYSNSANRFLQQLNTSSKNYLSQPAIIKQRWWITMSFSPSSMTLY